MSLNINHVLPLSRGNEVLVWSWFHTMEDGSDYIELSRIAPPYISNSEMLINHIFLFMFNQLFNLIRVPNYLTFCGGPSDSS